LTQASKLCLNNGFTLVNSPLPSHRLYADPFLLPQVDRRTAGLAELDVTVTSPVGDALPIDLKGLHGETGIDLVEFRPDVAGVYKFVIRYGGEQIPESPISFSVKESDSSATALDLRAFGQGLQKGQVI
jgi:hypothetical protein